jgi:hypothetical protein
MSVDAAEARIRAAVWQAIAEGSLDLSAVPKENLTSLVELVTDAALLELDDELGAIDTKLAHAIELDTTAKKEPESAENLTEDGERILWEGRPFLSLTRHYRITTERVRITEGLLGKDREDIELVKIQDIDQTQRMTERMLNLGDITIRSHDPSHPKVTLDNVRDVQRVHEILRRAMLDAREELNFSYREEM